MNQKAPHSLLIPCAAVAVAALLVYLNAFGHEFVYDDLPLITWNDRIKSPDRLWELFTTSYWNEGNTGLYRPLALVSLAANYAISGVETWSYTLTNVLLHVGTSVLLVMLTRSLGASVAAATAAGLIFAVHPVHTEAVTWTAGRAELLCGLCCLYTLYCHRRAEEHQGWRVGALFAFAVALYSKEHALTLLGVIPATDALFGRGSLRERLGARLFPEYAGLVVLAVVYLALRVVVLGETAWGPRFVVPLDNPLVAPVTSALGNTYGATTGERLLSAVALWSEHLRLLAWPAHLSADYSFAQWPPVRSPADGRFLIGLLALGGTLAGAFALRRRAPLAAWGLVFFVLTTSVTSQVLRPTGTVYAERLLYLPSVGFAVLCGVAFARAWRMKRTRVVAVTLLGTLLILGALRTWTRNPVWTNRRTLWEETVRTSPRSARARSKLGILYLEAAERLIAAGTTKPGRKVHRQLLAAAARELEEAVAIYPERAGVNLALGKAWLGLSEPARALVPLRRLEPLSGGAPSREQAQLWQRAVQGVLNTLPPGAPERRPLLAERDRASRLSAEDGRR